MRDKTAQDLGAIRHCQVDPSMRDQHSRMSEKSKEKELSWQRQQSRSNTLKGRYALDERIRVNSANHCHHPRPTWNLRPPRGISFKLHHYSRNPEQHRLDMVGVNVPFCQVLAPSLWAKLSSDRYERVKKWMAQSIAVRLSMGDEPHILFLELVTWGPKSIGYRKITHTEEAVSRMTWAKASPQKFKGTNLAETCLYVSFPCFSFLPDWPPASQPRPPPPVFWLLHISSFQQIDLCEEKAKS